jgi:hypothetical protein
MRQRNTIVALTAYAASGSPKCAYPSHRIPRIFGLSASDAAPTAPGAGALPSHPHSLVHPRPPPPQLACSLSSRRATTRARSNPTPLRHGRRRAAHPSDGNMRPCALTFGRQPSRSPAMQIWSQATSLFPSLDRIRQVPATSDADQGRKRQWRSSTTGSTVASPSPARRARAAGRRGGRRRNGALVEVVCSGRQAGRRICTLVEMEAEAAPPSSSSTAAAQKLCFWRRRRLDHIFLLRLLLLLLASPPLGSGSELPRPMRERMRTSCSKRFF